MVAFALLAFGCAASAGATCDITENFDAVTPPALPSAWEWEATGGGQPWQTTTLLGLADTPPNLVVAASATVASVSTLVSAAFRPRAAQMTLRFRQQFSLESAGGGAIAYDGGVLVAATGVISGEFTSAGGRFISGGYNATISSATGNPLGGIDAWSGNSDGYITTTIRLPPAAYGRISNLQWRLSSDSSNGGGLWALDTLDCASAEPSSPWVDAPDYPGSFDGPAVAVVDDIAYGFGGVLEAGDNDASTFSYRFDGNGWEPVTPLPKALAFAAAVSDGTRIFILGGFDADNHASGEVYRYDPRTDSYTQLASQTLPTAASAAVYLGGRIYEFAGDGAGGLTDVVQVYDVANDTWTLGTHYPQNLEFVAAFVRNGSIYAAGGLGPGETASTKTYRYDTLGDTWDDASIPDLPVSLATRAVANFGNRTILFGDVSNFRSGNRVWYWDGTSPQWREMAPMWGLHIRGAAVVLHGTIHVVGDAYGSAASETYDGLFSDGFESP